MNDNQHKAENIKIKADWKIFPIHWLTESGECSCGKNCNSPGKHPLTRNGFKDATNDRNKLKAWHERYPVCNWGVRTGSQDTGGSGFFVIDIDKKNNGLETWEGLTIDHLEPIETSMVKTEWGGKHLYFKQPDGLDI